MHSLTTPIETSVLLLADGSLALAGRTAVVTGGGSGIGRAAALALARNGATVVVGGRRPEPLHLVAEEIVAGGGQAVVQVVDVNEQASTGRLIETALQEFGTFDIAFNNAGYQERRSPIAEQADEAFDPVFDTNVRAVWRAMRYQIRHMTSHGGGVIINNGSVSGLRNPNPGLALYSASKAALISLTKSAALECTSQGVRVNMVSPARVVTDMMLSSGIGDMESVAAGLPLGRMGNPVEIANAVVWLASDASSYLVGHNLVVDGGFLAQ